MATKETTEARNEQKRYDIAVGVARAKAYGWSTADLALLCGVTTGCISSWGRGASMGTNADRQRLAALPIRSSPAGWDALEAAVSGRLEWAQKYPGHYDKQIENLTRALDVLRCARSALAATPDKAGGGR